MQTYLERAREIPVAAEAGVVVAGGGPGGLTAALAAAHGGAETVLIERHGFVGGMATAGLMTCINGFRNEHPPCHVQTVRGLAQELINRLLAAGGACECTAHGNFCELQPDECPYAVSIDPEVLKRVALEMLVEAGVKLMLHTWFSDAPSSGRFVEAAIVENKSGRQAVRGQIYVDAAAPALVTRVRRGGG
jgi:flavin-dependent dehydrogenase